MLEEEIEKVRKLLRVQKEMFGTECSESAQTRAKLADLYSAVGNYEKAEILYTRAMKIMQSLGAPYRSNVEKIQTRLEQLHSRGNPHSSPEASQTRFRETPYSSPEASQTRPRETPHGSPEASQTRSRETPHSSPEASQTRSRETPHSSPEASQTSAHSNAESIKLPKPTIRESKSTPSGEPRNADAGTVTQTRTAPTDATSSADEILDLQVKIDLIKGAKGNQHASVADLLTKLADVYCRSQMFEEMKPVLQEALAIREKQLGPTHLHVSSALKNLAMCYSALGQSEQAVPLLKRALAIREASLGRIHPKVVELTELCWQLQRSKEESLGDNKL